MGVSLWAVFAGNGRPGAFFALLGRDDLAGAFFAGDFFAAAFLAGAFFAGDFLVAAFLAGAFFAGDFLVAALAELFFFNTTAGTLC